MTQTEWGWLRGDIRILREGSAYTHGTIAGAEAEGYPQTRQHTPFAVPDQVFIIAQTSTLPTHEENQGDFEVVGPEGQTRKRKSTLPVQNETHQTNSKTDPWRNARE